MLEHVVCGETKIDAVDLRVAMKTLRIVDQNTGQTALEKQFQVTSIEDTTFTSIIIILYVGFAENHSKST